MTKTEIPEFRVDYQAMWEELLTHINSLDPVSRLTPGEVAWKMGQIHGSQIRTQNQRVVEAVERYGQER